VDILDNPRIWDSYQIASSQILNFPTVASDRDSVQESRGKLRLSEIYTPSIDPLEEIEKYRSSYENLQDTERRAVIQSRIGQGKFRADLVAYWGKCAVTGCQRVEILRASHIKPWSEASNQERLDVYNGLLLVPNLDVAFDAGYISFCDDGKIMISSYLTLDDQYRLGIHPKLCISGLAEKHINYLRYHRQYKFKGV
jgi:putative restriction endonuclease